MPDPFLDLVKFPESQGRFGSMPEGRFNSGKKDEARCKKWNEHSQEDERGNKLAVRDKRVPAAVH